METLTNLESFVRTAQAGSFSAAARQLGFTPAAVSRNVAILERNLGLRLFQRSTRKLTLTEAGEHFLASIAGHLDGLQTAIAGAADARSEPAGVLKLSLPPSFGTTHILPLLPGFLAQYPLVRPEWHFENRQVDLISEGYDAAVGGGFELPPGVVARPLAPAHIVAVAAPAYAKKLKALVVPGDLKTCRGIVMRNLRSGRIRHWTMRNAAGKESSADLPEHIVVNDPLAMREAALLGLGVALLATSDVQQSLEQGTLVRLLPRWYVDAGSISLYFVNRTLLPAKTRAFVDYVVAAFQREGLSMRLAGSIGS